MALEDQDPAEELEAQRQRLANALRTGVVENPDALAADRAEAQRRGMPVSRLRAIREVNGALPPANYDPDLPARAPATSNFLSNPANAAVAHDDIESLTGLERIVARGFYSPEESRQLIAQTAARNAREQGQSAARTPLGRLLERQGPGGRAAANLLRGVAEGTSRLAGGLARVDQTLFGGIEDFARRQYDRVGIPIYDFRPDEQGRFSIQRVRPAADGTTRTNQMTRALETPAVGYEAGTTWEEVKARPLQNVIPYALESGLVSLPDMAAALAVLPAYVVARTGGIGQDRAQNDGREEATVADLVAALPAASASAFLERLGTMGILGVGDELVRGGVRGVLGASARAGLQEGITEALQSGVEYAGTNLGTEAGFNPVTALDQMAAGAVAGTPFGATVRAATATGEIALGRFSTQQQAAEAGDQAAQTLGELATLAEASKLNERDPQTFQQFIEQTSEGTPVENVYVEAQAFAQALNDAGVPLEDVVAAIPALADQLPAALASGGDLRMTAGEFATHIAGTDATAALLPHLRTDPFGMSQAQAKDFMATRGEALQAEVEAATAQAQATEELRAGRERVRQKIAADLDTTGRFTKDVNAAYATLPSAFYDVMGARLGITAEQAAERYPLRTSGEMPTSAGREVMDQETDTVDLIHFSDNEGMTASDPSKWGASRATQNSERERRNAGAPGRTYFGVKGVYNGEPATGIARRPFQYQAQVPASKLYNFDADPQGLKPTEGTPAEIATAYEKAIQAAGFSGYRSDAVVPGAVALFDKVEVSLANVMAQEPLTPEQATARAAKLADEIPGLKGLLPYLTTDEKAKLRRDTAAKIAKMVEDFPDAEEMAAVAYSGRAKKGWYENSAKAILEIFGAQDAPRFAALLAALSPQTSVEANAFNALATWTNWINAGRPTGQREIVKIMGESVQGKGTEESVLNAWINNSVTALTAENPNDITLSGPKVNSFMLNLVGVVDEVTNDAWMANYALVEQSVFKKTGAVPGKGPGYMAMNAVARRAAEIVSEKTGDSWSAAEVQETVWSWAKTLYEKRDAAGERRTTKEIMAAGDLTAEDIGSTPDFAVLFVDGVFRRILEAGGYGAELDALDARGQPARRDGAGGDPRSVEGTGFDAGDFGRYVDQAAARLEELRARRREGAPAETPQLSLFDQGPVGEQPLEGQPQVVNIPGRGRTVFGPFKAARDAARKYMADAGLAFTPPTTYAKVDEARAKRIAQAFEDMKHDPADPQVAAAYRAMIDETLAQWQAIKDTGLKVEFIRGEDPYAATPRLAILDVVENNHLWVFPTDSGFGSSDLDVSDNPLLEKTGEVIDGHELVANDVFRIVHDYFGHIKDGNGFRADGEENAWQSHAAMYSPLARRAMTTETRGQNSWVNFGPKAEFNRTASASDTVYADQKIGLLPEWVSSEGFLGGPTGTANGTPATETAAFKAWFGDSVVKDEAGKPLVVYRGQHSGASDPETRLGSYTFGDRATASLYAMEPNDATQDRVAEAPFVIPAYLSIQKPILNQADGDPYIDFDKLVDALGLDETVAILRADMDLRDAAENTSAWQEGPGEEYASISEMLDKAPARVRELAALAFNVLDKPSVVAALKAAGFDGAVHGGFGENTGETEYRVFDPAQIKSVFNSGTFDPADPRILYQADPFYSALERAVETSSLTKAPAAQWKATLAKTPGVKKEELEWSGINDWLDTLEPGSTAWLDNGIETVDAKGNISREAVLGFLRAGGVQVDEVVLGDPVSEDLLSSSRLADVDLLAEDYFAADWATAMSLQQSYNSEPPTQEQMDVTRDRLRAAARRRAVREVAPDLETPTAFQTYKLPGADDTYRELLITLPNIDGPSTHWDTANVVAHARVTTRTDAEGKRVLFLEELQSDWHQKGRDQGYETPADPARSEPARRAMEASEQGVRDALTKVAAEGGEAFQRALAGRETMRGSTLDWLVGADAVAQRVFSGDLDSAAKRAVEDTLGVDRYLELRAEFLDAQQAYRLRVAELRVAEGGQDGIPDAPFRTSWSTLLMKRMIRYAVDNGAEKIAWINGNQQNGGQTGGDGSFFYERNLVNVTNDLLKKYGTRVEPVSFVDPRLQPALDVLLKDRDAFSAATGVDESATYQVPIENITRRPDTLGIQNGFEITPQLAEAARAGFALFQRNRGQIAFGADVSQSPSVISLLRAADLSTFIHETGHFFLEATAHMANQVDAPADIVADMSTVLNWFEPGMTQAQWNGMSLEQRRPYHEKWARGFEAYHFEGRAPSLALRDVFRRFSAWLKNVYKSLTALDVELTDEVRQVMDRMLANEAEIKEMEQVRGLAPAFATKPEFASEAEWAEYQKLGVEATAEAIEQLETRSARDMRWASGAKDRYVRSLQREAEEQRKAIRAEVTAEVMAEPVNRARAFLRRGLGENGEPVEGPTKLDLETLKALYGDAPARPAGPVGQFATPAEGPTWTKLRRGGKYGEVATDGLHPDIAASMFGYPNGEALIEDLVNGEDSADKIKGLTDQRMLERYGDLSSPQDIERAANEAVANEARGKFVAAEMAMADKAIGKKSILNNAAKEFAAQVVNRLELKRLRPAQYLAAQGRAAKAADKALKADDLPAFATAKRNQLINLHTGRAVQQAQKDVEKTMRLFTRIVSAKDDSISKSRNMDLVNAARAILSSYGVGRVKNDPAGYMKALAAYDPTLYADIEPFVNGARGDAKPVVDLTYEQFQALRDTVNQLWVLSRRTKQIEIDGKLMDRAVVTAELGQRLEDVGIPAQAGLDRAPTDKDVVARYLLGTRAALRRVESWARGVDAADRGPFRRYIWNPISAAADAYRAESGVYIRRFRALLDDMRAELKPGDIKAPEIGYTFGGKSELFHALLHTGNGSNKSKLLLGRGWGKKLEDGSLDDTRWQSFVDRLHAEGVLTAKDWTFVQAVWDLLEETKPGAQRAHRAIYGRYFDEVSADPVDTPFGQLRGGYVPALTDSFLVQDAVLRAEQEAIEGGDSAMFPAASNGFTKSRVEDYTRELALDLRLLPMHIDKVLKFTHLGPPVRDVARLLKDRGFSKKLQAFDPTAQSDLLLPWLQRAAKQLVETPSKGFAGKAADRFFSAVRSRVGMQLMFANVVNTAQQVTGFSNVMLRVKPAVVGDALWRYVRDPKGVSDAATSQSVFLANRMNSDIFEARQVITQLTKLNPSKKDEAVDFLKRHAYFMQSALQNVMDVVSWTAAYNQATAKGEDAREAVRFADSVIRETQGTMAPEDVSRFETGAPFIRMFTQFAGYFNMMANLNATEVQITARSVGLKKGMGRLFYVYLMGFAIPALLGDAIAKALRGGWEDEDDDGYMDDMFAWFFSSQAKFALAAVPVVGQAGNAVLGTLTGAPYDDRLALSPAVSVIESGLTVPAEAYQTLVEGESFNRADVRNTLNLLGVLMGTPVGALAKPVGYGVGVAQGDIEPTSPADAARGVVTGAPSPESRQ